METILTDSVSPKDLIEFNLFAYIKNNKVIKLIMPDEYGEMQEKTPSGLNWYAIKWPVNPHFTGENMVIGLIESRFPFKEKA